MSGTPVSAQRSIGFGRLAVEERLLLRLVTWGILLALAVAVVLLRLQRLDELPPGLLGPMKIEMAWRPFTSCKENTLFSFLIMVLDGRLRQFTFWLCQHCCLGVHYLPYICPRRWAAPARSLPSSGSGGCSLGEMKKANRLSRGAVC